MERQQTDWFRPHTIQISQTKFTGRFLKKKNIKNPLIPRTNPKQSILEEKQQLAQEKGEYLQANGHYLHI